MNWELRGVEQSRKMPWQTFELICFAVADVCFLTQFFLLMTSAAAAASAAAVRWAEQTMMASVCRLQVSHLGHTGICCLPVTGDAIIVCCHS
jgi:hypothetical protein